MSDGPKLYANKPKKAQMKHSTESMGAPPPPPSSAPPPPPPQPPKESFARRYKFVWPLLLTVNLALGAYMFTRTKKKNPGMESGEASVDAPSTPTASTATVPDEKISTTPPIREPINVREPIPEDQQRQLFKWVLEEKRKVKPKDPEEKKRLDEEKAILKQFIRAKSLPSI